jgi:hypothetical protein
VLFIFDYRDLVHQELHAFLYINTPQNSLIAFIKLIASNLSLHFLFSSSLLEFGDSGVLTVDQLLSPQRRKRLQYVTFADPTVTVKLLSSSRLKEFTPEDRTLFTSAVRTLNPM